MRKLCLTDGARRIARELIAGGSWRLGRGILLTDDFGSGHTLAAMAVAQAWNRIHPDEPVEVVRSLERSHPFLTHLVIGAYLVLLRRWPGGYRWMYRATEVKPRLRGGASGVLAALYARSFRVWMSRLDPDWAMTTHPFSLALLERFRAQGWRGRFGTLVTDFHVHRFWWSRSADWYCVPFPWMREELADLGYPQKNIHVTGFPLRPAFSAPIARGDAQRRLGWEDVPRVLCMGGGFGLGDVARWLNWLDESALEFEMVVVAGRNERLYRELTEKSRRWKHPCRILGYRNDIQDLFAACDVLVSKPGAATVMEAAAMELPFVCAAPLPGHEEDNARALVKLGIISGPAVGAAMLRAVERLLLDEEARCQVKDRLRGMVKPDAAESVADVLGSEQTG
ncbi:MAG: glycosyltransferase [Kyrpidia sp.]|nr:glycosyltransferase [Kyrpidia sp.]